MEELRLKGKDALKKIFNKEQNITIFEKNIYEVTLKQMKKYEKIEDIYTFNIYQFIIQFIMKVVNIKIIIFILEVTKSTFDAVGRGAP